MGIFLEKFSRACSVKLWKCNIMGGGERVVFQGEALKFTIFRVEVITKFYWYK